ncbi:MAG: translational GTPase TypA [Gammaproteobacteria bacterium]|nr:translational GTPase TypA [Gammaproteobacteria bacterium]
MFEGIRNIAIIAHVDHGKTTLVDQLLKCSGMLAARVDVPSRALDSSDLEKERGITILSKNTAIRWQNFRINIVDTPGHADFGGEVERVLSMVDSVLLVVDAVDGPMPQTRFVTMKAFSHGLNPIVIVNKVDRPGSRPDWVVEQIFDLFDRLGAHDEQLDFPVVYTSALQGTSGVTATGQEAGMDAVFEAITEHCPPPGVNEDGPFQMQISSLDYSSYVGAIAIGRIFRGTVRRNDTVAVVGIDGSTRREKISQILGFEGLERVEIQSAAAGDIVALAGIERPRISDTLCHPDAAEALPGLTVDEPTISMVFETNSSPFAGLEGKFVTSRQIRERLMRETLHNVALRVADTDDPEKFRVSGRGELHLSILLETMRREGYELAVSRPRVIFREIDGVRQEPYELLAVDIEERDQGAVMEALGERGGKLSNMTPDGNGRTRLDYKIPSRGLIGFQTHFRTLTSGNGMLYHVFDEYREALSQPVAQRQAGVLISTARGKALAYALFNLQERGRLFIRHADEVYEGQIVGQHNRDNDLPVNPLKGKQLTNVRASGRDEKIVLTPAIEFSLEQALEFIDDDELVEITPQHIRLRKRFLKEHERKRASRQKAADA